MASVTDKISPGIKNLGNDISRLFALVYKSAIPNVCLACDRIVERQGGCCAQCWSQLQFISSPMCPVLGSPFSVDMGNNIHCAEAIASPPPFERLRAAVIYDDLARRIISGIKYADQTNLVPWIANWMTVAGKELLNDADMVVPVPLHSRRLLARRFNQSAEFARCIARVCDVEYAPLILKRRKATKQQVGLTEQERERNVSGAFAVPIDIKPLIKQKRILLVDDVYTTGATIRAATRTLLRAGADKVDVLVFAKVETQAA